MNRDIPTHSDAAAASVLDLFAPISRIFVGVVIYIAMI